MKDIKVEIINAPLLPEDRKYRLKEVFNILLSRPKRTKNQPKEKINNLANDKYCKPRKG